MYIERDEIGRIEQNIHTCILGAIRNYTLALSQTNSFDREAVFAFFSIWFEIISDSDKYTGLSETALSVSNQILETFALVPLYKYLPLVYQLSSRLDKWSESSPNHVVSFLKTVFVMLRRIAIMHPFHVFYKLLAMANLSEVPSSKREREWYVVNESKMIAAQLLLSKISTSHPSICQNMKKFSSVIIQFMIHQKNLPKSSQKDQSRKIKFEKIGSELLKNDSYCIIPTQSFPIQKDGKYDENYAKKHSAAFFDEFAVWASSGINRPLIVRYTLGSGNRCGMVIKTDDDLRQDAVMEQVFDLVNDLLIAESESRKKNLRMVTYNVCPLSPYVGLVEFVNNSRSLGDWLIPAHEKYYPNDWKYSHCRVTMDSRSQKNSFSVFCDVIRNFRPVFRNFFIETTHDSSNWLKKRVIYARSLAVSSMVGFILGLGDRHLQNILIDYESGELVHIDLGIAFDAGRLLPIPETVPFRLTRDILDGLGVCGVDGIFKKSCVLVMDLLRRKQKMILTLLSVFVYDPLYSWSISPVHAKKQMRSDETEINLFEDPISSSDSSGISENHRAKAAVLRVKDKLEGIVEGFQLSVEGQVDVLVHQATDVDRLSRIFPGWSAWC
jgi:ataxia telangiectasia mutated family protein